jgi:hypothetical protein
MVLTVLAGRAGTAKQSGDEGVARLAAAIGEPARTRTLYFIRAGEREPVRPERPNT